MISIKGCVELAIRGLEVYVHGSEERLIQAAREDKIDGLKAASVFKRSKKEKRLENWEEKALHVLALASEWRFEKGERKSYSSSSESDYKNKSS